MRADPCPSTISQVRSNWPSICAKSNGSSCRPPQVDGAGYFVEQCAEFRGARRSLQDEHHLHHGPAAGIAFRLELFDQQRERQILVCQRAEHRLANLTEEVTKGRIAGKIGAERQRIGEIPDCAGHVRIVSSRHRRTDDDVVLAGVAVQQGLEHGQEAHIQRRALSLTDFRQRHAPSRRRSERNGRPHAASGPRDEACSSAGRERATRPRAFPANMPKGDRRPVRPGGGSATARNPEYCPCTGGSSA